MITKAKARELVKKCEMTTNRTSVYDIINVLYNEFYLSFETYPRKELLKDVKLIQNVITEIMFEKIYD